MFRAGAGRGGAGGEIGCIRVHRIFWGCIRVHRFFRILAKNLNFATTVGTFISEIVRKKECLGVPSIFYSVIRIL